MTALNDGTVTAFGNQMVVIGMGKYGELKRFSLEKERELSSTDVNKRYGITEMTLGGRPTIVVSGK